MLEKEIHFLLMRCFHHSNRLIASQTYELDLHPGQPKILEYLYDHNKATAKEIGEYLVIDKSTMTSLLSRMLKQKLITKTINPHDKRSYYISLTDTGYQKALQVKEIGWNVDKKIWNNINESQQKQFIETLRIMMKNMEE